MNTKSKHYFEYDRNMSVEQANELKNSLKNSNGENVSLKSEKEEKKSLRYFAYGEFDSPDDIGSGQKYMNRDFLMLLDRARESAGIPFKINSGFRTKAYNIDLEKRGYKVAKNSAHLKGLAVDIATPNSSTRFKVLQALAEQNITRIGIGKNFIHCDTDKTKSQNVLWHYY